MASILSSGEASHPESAERFVPDKPRRLLWIAISFSVTLPMLLGGCRLAEETVKAPVKAVTAVVPGAKSTPFDPAALQVELQRFADEYASRTTAALDDYAEIVGTPEARHQALLWKVSAGFAAVGIASGPNPRANLIDFLALVTITRTALEHFWSKSTNGPAFKPWLETTRALETNIWKIAATTLDAGQQQELSEVIRKWWDVNPRVREGFFVRPQEFSSLVRETNKESDRPGSVFGMVGLDPTAGLDPAVREVTRTRLFAERAMFVFQRMPFLLRWQTELLAGELLRQDQLASAIASADRLSRAVESASHTAAQLPDQIAVERQAILKELETQEGKLRELSAEIGRALVAGEKMSTSLNTTLITFDALMKRFGVGEPTTRSKSTNTTPFNILDYARTAEEIASAAQQLDALIKDAGSTLDSPALDKRINDLNSLSSRARADAKSVLNHAFLLALALIALTLGATVALRRFGRSKPT